MKLNAKLHFGPYRSNEKHYIKSISESTYCINDIPWYKIFVGSHTIT